MDWKSERFYPCRGRLKGNTHYTYQWDWYGPEFFSTKNSSFQQIPSFWSIFLIYVFWVPISAVEGPHWVPISLKIRSPLGPNEICFRSSFNVGAVQWTEPLDRGVKYICMTIILKWWMSVLWTKILLARNNNLFSSAMNCFRPTLGIWWNCWPHITRWEGKGTFICAQ